MNKLIAVLAVAVMFAGNLFAQTITPVAPPAPQQTVVSATLSGAQVTSIVNVMKANQGAYVALPIPSGTVKSINVSVEFQKVVSVTLADNTTVSRVLTATQSGNLLNAIISPPSGAAYNNIALPSGKTANNIKSFGVFVKPDVSGALSIRF